MATFGSFAGLATGAVGALCSSELQLLHNFPSALSNSNSNNQASPSPADPHSNVPSQVNKLQATASPRPSVMSRFAVSSSEINYDSFDMVFAP